MNNYQTTFRNIFYFIIAIQVSLFLFGYLRPSIIYDYLDNWPLSILPVALLLINRNYFKNELLNNYLFGILIIIFTTFPIVLMTGANVLTTNSFDAEFKNFQLSAEVDYVMTIDTEGSIILDFFEGSGYKVDILNRPGKTGFPEALQANLGNPQPIRLREVSTDRLLQVSGWKLDLGNKTNWELDILSFDSNYYLDSPNLGQSKFIGTGEIFLGPSLSSGDIVINGIFNISVDRKLPIVVIGNADVPANWINATIGYLNQTNGSYILKVIVEDGSTVVFEEGE
ncbi:MAG: hypothetical protein H2033_00395 [Candidatus Actinomarinales bacterium]|nr:hypothetical protein [Candidatus Actinomarinales bacterium]